MERARKTGDFVEERLFSSKTSFCVKKILSLVPSLFSILCLDLPRYDKIEKKL